MEWRDYIIIALAAGNLYFALENIRQGAFNRKLMQTFKSKIGERVVALDRTSSCMLQAAQKEGLDVHTLRETLAEWYRSRGYDFLTMAGAPEKGACASCARFAERLASQMITACQDCLQVRQAPIFRLHRRDQPRWNVVQTWEVGEFTEAPTMLFLDHQDGWTTNSQLARTWAEPSHALIYAMGIREKWDLPTWHVIGVTQRNGEARG